MPADARGNAGKLHAPTKDGRVKSFMDHEDSVYSELAPHLLAACTLKMLMCACS